jgi:hypothetical protein
MKRGAVLVGSPGTSGKGRFEEKNRPPDKLLHLGSRDDVSYRYRVATKTKYEESANTCM